MLPRYNILGKLVTDVFTSKSERGWFCKFDVSCSEDIPFKTDANKRPVYNYHKFSCICSGKWAAYMKNHFKNGDLISATGFIKSSYFKNHEGETKHEVQFVIERFQHLNKLISGTEQLTTNNIQEEEKEDGYDINDLLLPQT